MEDGSTEKIHASRATQQHFGSPNKSDPYHDCPQPAPQYGYFQNPYQQPSNQNPMGGYSDQQPEFYTTDYGAMYFDMNDPAIAKQNIPERQGNIWHPQIIFANLVLWGMIVLVALGVNKFLSTSAAVILMIISYIFYLAFVLCCNKIKDYLSNLKRNDEYAKIYADMVEGRGYFQFWIECYHMSSSGTGKNRRTTKVVTHTAKENFYPQLSIDMSGKVSSILEQRRFIFIEYQKKYFFENQNAQAIIDTAFNNFVNRNKRDSSQNKTNTFQIVNFQPEVGFCEHGDEKHHSILFYLTTFLGLALPYSCIIQASVARYRINMVKRLTY